MASPVSFIRSAARATFSAYRRLPIRWRLAGGSALLTAAILCGFAGMIGVLTTRQIRADFNNRLELVASNLQREVLVRPGRQPPCVGPDLNTYGRTDDAAIRVVTLSGEPLCQTKGAPDLGFPREKTAEVNGFRVESRLVPAPPLGQAILQYARPMSDVNRTIGKVRFFLLLGVLGGTLLALAVGVLVARRAMQPIAELTATAREITRTRDAARGMPDVEADDEIAQLARTLESMLAELDRAQTETEEMLSRQRSFVADASHELRTPLTSVLANLELLSEQLHGEQRSVVDSALRSSHRMRRLVADLLLLARADAGRRASRAAVDLGSIAVEAASELEPVAGDHELTVDAELATVTGVRDDLLRLTLNLIENGLRHTPPGSSVDVSVRRDNGDAVLSVEDDGAGVPEALAPHVFERFVRGDGDSGGSSGLGLAIVRAVAESHGGTVALEPGEGGRGSKFVVRLPADVTAEAPEPVPAGASS